MDAATNLLIVGVIGLGICLVVVIVELVLLAIDINK